MLFFHPRTAVKKKRKNSEKPKFDEHWQHIFLQNILALDAKTACLTENCIYLVSVYGGTVVFIQNYINVFPFNYFYGWQGKPVSLSVNWGSTYYLVKNHIVLIRTYHLWHFHPAIFKRRHHSVGTGALQDLYRVGFLASQIHYPLQVFSFHCGCLRQHDYFIPESSSLHDKWNHVFYITKLLMASFSFASQFINFVGNLL